MNIYDYTRVLKNSIIRTIFVSEPDTFEKNITRKKLIDFINAQEFQDGMLIQIIVTQDPRKIVVDEPITGGKKE